MFQKVQSVEFPAPRGLWVNMMPIVAGASCTIPEALRGYADIVAQCGFRPGSTIYLSVRESYQFPGTYQSRPGIHTEAAGSVGWGGWGGIDRDVGLYMASSTGECELFDCKSFDTDDHGAMDHIPDAPGHEMEPGTLYWMTDRTPHRALPAQREGMRQWVRVVSEDVGVWYALHSTPNPLGVNPPCPVSIANKFQ